MNVLTTTWVLEFVFGKLTDISLCDIIGDILSTHGAANDSQRHFAQFWLPECAEWSMFVGNDLVEGYLVMGDDFLKEEDPDEPEGMAAFENRHFEVLKALSRHPSLGDKGVAGRPEIDCDLIRALSERYQYLIASIEQGPNRVDRAAMFELLFLQRDFASQFISCMANKVRSRPHCYQDKAQMIYAKCRGIAACEELDEFFGVEEIDGECEEEADWEEVLKEEELLLRRYVSSAIQQYDDLIARATGIERVYYDLIGLTDPELEPAIVALSDASLSASDLVTELRDHWRMPQTAEAIAALAQVGTKLAAQGLGNEAIYKKSLSEHLALAKALREERFVDRYAIMISELKIANEHLFTGATSQTSDWCRGERVR